MAKNNYVWSVDKNSILVLFFFFFCNYMSSSNCRRPHQCWKLSKGDSHEFRIIAYHYRRPAVRRVAHLHEYEPHERYECGSSLHHSLFLCRHAGRRVQRHHDQRCSSGVRDRCRCHSGCRSDHVQLRVGVNTASRSSTPLCGAARGPARCFGSSLPDGEW